MDLIERITQEMKQRMEELRPQIEEIPRLEAALAALDRQADSGRAAPPAPRSRGRRRSAQRRARRGRVRVSGSERRSQLLSIIRENPEVKVRDIAAAMNTSANNVYNLIRRLEAEGALSRSDGRLIVTG